MKIKVYYDKNLKMSEGKLAAQVGHVCKELGRVTGSIPETDVIIVLGVSARQFNLKKDSTVESKRYHYVQCDGGYTEVKKGTITCFGYIEEV